MDNSVVILLLGPILLKISWKFLVDEGLSTRQLISIVADTQNGGEKAV